MTFPQQLKRARKRLRLSQSELAQRLGMSLRTLQEWEQGRQEPAPMMRGLVAEKLGKVK